MAEKSIKYGDIRVLQDRNPKLAQRLFNNSDIENDRFRSAEFKAALKAARNMVWEPLEQFLYLVPTGFHQLFFLKKDELYSGQAQRVMLVWNKSQIIPANQYRVAHSPDQKVDIVVCENPNIQKAQMGDNAIIYNYND